MYVRARGTYNFRFDGLKPPTLKPQAPCTYLSEYVNFGSPKSHKGGLVQVRGMWSAGFRG